MFLLIMLFLYPLHSFELESFENIFQPSHYDESRDYVTEIDSYYKPRQNTMKKFYDQQAALVVREVAKGVVVKPIRALKKIYDKRILKKKSDLPSMQYLLDHLEQYQTTQVNLFGEKIEKQCSAWKQNEDKNCDCSKVCPMDLRILDFPDSKTPFEQAQPENLLSFRNNDEFNQVSNYRYQGGFCWGHAMATQSMNRLAIFREHLRATDSDGVELAIGSKKFVEFYKDIIHDIVVKKKPRVIPGFKNLFEFSNTAPFNKMLANEVARLWKKQIFGHTQPTKFFVKGLTGRDDNLYNKNVKVFDAIKKRIKLGLAPMAIFNVNNDPVAHVALSVLYAKNDRNRTEKICFEDSNSSSDHLLVSSLDFQYSQIYSCQSEIILDRENQSLSFIFNNQIHKKERVTQLEIAFNQDKQTLTQMKNLNNLCRKLLCSK